MATIAPGLSGLGTLSGAFPPDPSIGHTIFSYGLSTWSATSAVLLQVRPPEIFANPLVGSSDSFVPSVASKVEVGQLSVTLLVYPRPLLLRRSLQCAVPV